jgi:hypothetical protein
VGQEVVLFHSARPASGGSRVRGSPPRRRPHGPHAGLVRGQGLRQPGGRHEEARRDRHPGAMSRAQAAIADLPPGLVFAGFSTGTGAAESLAGTRPRMRGAILMHSALDPARIGLEAWPRFQCRRTTPRVTRWWTPMACGRSSRPGLWDQSSVGLGIADPGLGCVHGCGGTSPFRVAGPATRVLGAFRPAEGRACCRRRRGRPPRWPTAAAWAAGRTRHPWPPAAHSPPAGRST